MAKIEIYSKEWYRCCTTAKALFRNKDLSYKAIDVTADAVSVCKQEKIEHSQRRMVPQIFIVN
ncbi:MAG: glutaredoxin domain-containing protein, partial [Thiogranum sp.]